MSEPLKLGVRMDDMPAKRQVGSEGSAEFVGPLTTGRGSTVASEMLVLKWVRISQSARKLLESSEIGELEARRSEKPD
jgi:hypothetical protein